MGFLVVLLDFWNSNYNMSQLPSGRGIAKSKQLRPCYNRLRSSLMKALYFCFIKPKPKKGRKVMLFLVDFGKWTYSRFQKIPKVKLFQVDFWKLNLSESLLLHSIWLNQWKNKKIGFKWCKFLAKWTYQNRKPVEK